MKDAMLILPRYLLLLIIITAVLSLFTMLVAEDAQDWSQEALLSSIDRALLPGVVTSLFVSFFFVTKRSGTRILSIILLISASSAALFFTPFLTDVPDSEEPSALFPFHAGEIENIRSGALFAARVEPEHADLKGLVWLYYRNSGLRGSDPVKSGPLDLAFFPAANYDRESSTIEAGTESIRVVPENPVVSPLLAPPRFLASLFGDIGTLRRYMKETRRSSFPSYLFACLALGAFSVSCLLFSHLSRWNLINFLLTVFMFRGLFLLFPLFSGEITAELFSHIEYPLLKSQLPMVLFALLAAAFLAADLLVPRSSE